MQKCKVLLLSLYTQRMDVRDIGEGKGMGEEEDTNEEEGDGMEEVGEDIGEEAEQDTGQAEGRPIHIHIILCITPTPIIPIYPGMRIVW